METSGPATLLWRMRQCSFGESNTISSGRHGNFSPIIIRTQNGLHRSCGQRGTIRLLRKYQSVVVLFILDKALQRCLVAVRMRFAS